MIPADRRNERQPVATTLRALADLVGGDILGDAELRELTAQLLRIHRAILPQNSKGANAMDVEFALTAQRRLVMLQARPYTIVYSLDRAKRPQRDANLAERVMARLRKLAYRMRTLRRRDT